MPQVVISVREVGGKKHDYSLLFDLPAVPSVGDYISVHREDVQSPHTEDVIVRHVWWQLECSEVRTAPSAETVQVGDIGQIVVECEPAIGPNSTDRWRDTLEKAKARGVEVPKFDLVRPNVRQDAMQQKPRR